MVHELMHNFQALGVRMSTEMHFLTSHLDYFPENCSDYRDEQGEPKHSYDGRTISRPLGY